jgi:hypothetical protein
MTFSTPRSSPEARLYTAICLFSTNPNWSQLAPSHRGQQKCHTTGEKKKFEQRRLRLRTQGGPRPSTLNPQPPIQTRKLGNNPPSKSPWRLFARLSALFRPLSVPLFISPALSASTVIPSLFHLIHTPQERAQPTTASDASPFPSRPSLRRYLGLSDTAKMLQRGPLREGMSGAFLADDGVRACANRFRCYRDAGGGQTQKL